MSKNLIYFTLNYNIEYLELAKLCIGTLIKTDYKDDILFITNSKKEISEEIKYPGNIFYMELPKTDMINSSVQKLKIYQFEFIEDYEKIIFCDLDTIWLKSPDILFDLIVDDKFYVANDNYTNLLMSTHHNFYGK